MKRIFNYFKSQSRARLIITAVLAIGIVVALISISLFLRDYFIIKQVVSLNPSPNTSIAIAQQQNDSLDMSQTIASTSTPIKIRVNPGRYVIQRTAGKDYKEDIEAISITKNTVITTDNMIYTKEKLDEILAQQRPAINSLINTIKPDDIYVVDNEMVLKQGNWYAARLVPGDWYLPASDSTPLFINANNKKDILRFILKKEGSNWTVVAKPSIYFNLESYPDIPQEIVRIANSLGFEVSRF